MKRILFLIAVIVPIVLNGQVYLQNGTIDAYTKAQLQTAGQAIINPANVTGTCTIVPATDATNGDSLVTVNNNVIGKIRNITVTSEFAQDTNTYFTGASFQGSTTTAGLATNAMRAFPIFVGNTMIIDKIAVEVTTGTTSNFVYGVYTNENAYPKTKIFTSQEFSGASVTVLTQLLTSTFTLTKNNIYWIVVESSAAPTMRAAPVYSLINVLGSTTGANGQYTCYHVAATYDGLLPTTFPAGATKIANVALPILFMQRQ